MSLALMVVTSEFVKGYVKDIILLHVAGTALLTLLINATTTGALVNYLGLSKQTDLQKNILSGFARNIEEDVSKKIKSLRANKYYKFVEWDTIQNSAALTQL